MNSPTPEQLRHEAAELRAMATRLEVLAIAVEAEASAAETMETAAAEAAKDHPDLRPSGQWKTKSVRR